jgi:thymidine phosphorylase
MLRLADPSLEFETALERSREALSSGAALERFRAMVEAQGGDPGILEDPSLLPRAPHIVDVLHEDGEPAWVVDVDARAIAELVLETGAGRRAAGDSVNPSTGLSGLACVGDPIRPGDCVARLHHPDPSREADWVGRIRSSITLQREPVVVNDRIHKKIE